MVRVDTETGCAARFSRGSSSGSFSISMQNVSLTIWRMASLRRGKTWRGSGMWKFRGSVSMASWRFNIWELQLPHSSFGGAHMPRQHSQMNASSNKSSNKSSVCCSNWLGYEVVILTPVERQHLGLGQNPTLLAREGTGTAGLAHGAHQLATAHVDSVLLSLTSEAGQVGVAAWFGSALVYRWLNNGEELQCAKTAKHHAMRQPAR